MNMVQKKETLYGCLWSLLIVIISGFPILVSANPSNVSDCLEEGDCLEIEEEVQMDEQNEELLIETKKGSLAVDIAKTVFALLLILLLIYMMLRIMKRKNRLMSDVKVLENLGGISVGSNKSIQIVRVGTRVYMIGVGENVELLQEIEDEEIINDLSNRTENKEREMSSLLESFFNRKNGKTEEDNSFQSFNKLFSNELKKLKDNRNTLIKKYQKKDDEHE